MPRSVLDAIKLGMWDFEPDSATKSEFDRTAALPGIGEELAPAHVNGARDRPAADAGQPPRLRVHVLPASTSS